MDVITAKLITVIGELIESNDKNISDGNGVYEAGYLNGYNDALVDVLNQMRIKNDYEYYD